MQYSMTTSTQDIAFLNFSENLFLRHLGSFSHSKVFFFWLSMMEIQSRRMRLSALDAKLSFLQRIHPFSLSFHNLPRSFNLSLSILGIPFCLVSPISFSFFFLIFVRHDGSPFHAIHRTYSYNLQKNYKKIRQGGIEPPFPAYKTGVITITLLAANTSYRLLGPLGFEPRTKKL